MLGALGRLGTLAFKYRIVAIFYYFWASPNTLVGLAWALLARLTTGGWAIHTGVIEAHGGWTAHLLRHLPFVKGGALAITIGHVVIARDQDALDRTRTHERVHVRQFEKWGPVFMPAYVLAGRWQVAKGKGPYRDNPFEVQAYGASPSDTQGWGR